MRGGGDEKFMIPKTIIHLLSGGLDSVTMLYDLKQQGHSIHCALFNYGQPHSKELWLAEKHCKRLDVKFTTIDLPRLGGLTEESWIVPNRNAIMLHIAVNLAVQAKADTVTIGCNADDEAGFPDCRMALLEAMNLTLKTAEVPVEVCAPYLDWPKWKVAGLSRELGVDMSEVWTCYLGGIEPCGECPACKKLELALAHD